jgi:hypothetical protein
MKVIGLSTGIAGSIPILQLVALRSKSDMIMLRVMGDWVGGGDSTH